MPARETVELAILLSGLARSAITALPPGSITDIESVALLASPSKETSATSDNTLPAFAVWKPSNPNRSSSMMDSWAMPLRMRM